MCNLDKEGLVYVNIFGLIKPGSLGLTYDTCSSSVGTNR